MRDAAGHASANTLVVASSGKSEFEGPEGLGLTDRAGHYRVAGLPPGRYQVCALPGGANALPPVGCQRVSVRAGQFAHVDAQLRAGGSVRVVARSPRGTPLPGVDVVVVRRCDQSTECDRIAQLSGNVRIVASIITDVNGHGVAAGLTAGSYAVCGFGWDIPLDSGRFADACSAGFTVTVTAGTSSSAVIALSPAATVSGRITDGDGHPVADVGVELAGAAVVDEQSYEVPAFDASGDGFVPVSSLDTELPLSDKNGRFSFSLVHPGVQQLCLNPTYAEVDGNGRSNTGFAPTCLAGKVTIRPGANTLNLILPRAAAISGTITGPTPSQLSRQSAVLVFAADAERVVGYAQPGPLGRYSVRGLRAGRYRVCFVADGYDSQCYKNISWPGRSLPAGITDVVVASGRTVTAINADLHRSRR